MKVYVVMDQSCLALEDDIKGGHGWRREQF